ncbi:MAG: ribonuclease HII [Oceanihabitans sp.]
MKKICLSLLLIILLFNCKPSSKNKNASYFIPENTSVIVSINNIESLKSSLQNNDLLNNISKSNSLQNIQEKLAHLKHLKTNQKVLLCFTYDSNNNLQYTVITKQIKDLFSIDSLPNMSVETYTYQNQKINKTQIENTINYTAFKDSIFIASSSKAILEATLFNANKKTSPSPLLKTTNPNKAFSVLINNKEKHSVKSIFIKDSTLFSNLSTYTLLDADISQDQITLNGICKATDSTKSIISIFKNTIPQKNRIANITPSNADGFISFTFDDFLTFNENLKKHNTNRTTISNPALFENSIEVGVIYEGENRAVVLNTIDVIATQDALLNEQDIAENYREISIYNFKESKLFSNTFSPLITFNNANYYAQIDGYFVFSNNIETLENIIASYQNKNTYNEKSYYQNLKESLTNESSLLLVTNSKSLKNILENNLDEKLNTTLSKYKTTALQFIYDSHFGHVNCVIQKNKSKRQENSVTELYNIKLEADLLNNPQIVTNHITKQKEIIVQDINNNLYLISNTGKVLWKKQIKGAILGKVNQIDMYKNGRLQLAFATSNRVYVIDRKGNLVKPFPLKFNDKITQPLAVFDYDKNKKYRLIVTQGKNILMYDAKGKTVKGFNFKAAASPLNSIPQHIRISNKDYLIFKTNTKINIVDRRGKTRVKIKDKHSFSNQKVYAYKRKFCTTTKNGKFVSIDTKGNSVTTNKNLSESHQIVTTSKTFVALSGNKLTIKDKTIELDFGQYDVPKLFYINNKIYISVTDLQAHKVYLYDSNAKLLPNFPVYGNAAITLANINKNKNLEFVTKGENNAILIYSLN